jgi:ATP synthase protein I
MSDPDRSSKGEAGRKRLEQLDKRLNAARKAGDHGPRTATGQAIEQKSGLAVAWRISIELAVAIGVCAAIGIAFDRWLGTTPWLLILFLFLGFGAGIRNVYKTTQDMAAAAEQADDKTDGRHRHS